MKISYGTILVNFLLLLIVACSSGEKENKKQDVAIVSPSVSPPAPLPSLNHYFSSAEQIAWDRYQKYISSGMSHQEALLLLRRYNGNRQSANKNDDLRIQAEQHLSYFCIVNEEHPKFSTHHRCLEWGNQVFLRCEVVNYGQYSKPLLDCLKRDLSKGLQ